MKEVFAALKYKTSDIFGSTEIDTGERPMWKITNPSAEHLELLRLQHAVIEKAKHWELMYGDATSDFRLRRAVKELVEFEKKNG
jgi:hypothetical protein